ncbi:MAG TPA: GNAT family N-acetyltransferase [Ilumatobacter sp.]|nr:GNAT family N-acetyltransferase [Ilumatobacter sp.]
MNPTTDPHRPIAAGPVEIRAASLHDRPAIDAFAAVVIPDTYAPLAGTAYADELLTAWWGLALDRDIAAGAVTIAVDTGRVVGLAHVGDLDGTPVLWKLYVDPQRRSTGIGAALVDHVAAALPAGTTRLLVEHIAANVDAARFYRRHGFARTRVEPHADRRLATVWRGRRIGHTDPAANHGHGHDEFDWSAMAGQLVAWDRAYASVYAEMAAWLGPRPGWRVADIGSGAGGFAAALAARIAPSGQVTLVDTDTELLVLARSHQPAHAEVATVHTDVDRQELPAGLAGGFDLVHAGGVVHHTDDQLHTVRNLTALLAPGGRLVIAEGGLAARFLPSEYGLGEPDLEVRLQAATIDWFWNEVRPAGATVATDAGWGTLLTQAGLTQVESRTFLLDIPPPLDPDLRQLVATTLAGTAARAGHRLAPDDHAAIAALVDPGRRDSVHHRPDAFILAARTLHVGTRTD